MQGRKRERLYHMLEVDAVSGIVSSSSPAFSVGGPASEFLDPSSLESVRSLHDLYAAAEADEAVFRLINLNQFSWVVNQRIRNASIFCVMAWRMHFEYSLTGQCHVVIQESVEPCHAFIEESVEPAPDHCFVLDGGFVAVSLAATGLIGRQSCDVGNWRSVWSI